LIFSSSSALGDGVLVAHRRADCSEQLRSATELATP
jgi:hypothetical protein